MFQFPNGSPSVTVAVVLGDSADVVYGLVLFWLFLSAGSVCRGGQIKNTLKGSLT